MKIGVVQRENLVNSESAWLPYLPVVYGEYKEVPTNQCSVHPGVRTSSGFVDLVL
jgi:hypothetical protein